MSVNNAATTSADDVVDADVQNTILAKSVTMCVLFVASMTLGSLPLLFKRLFKWNADASNPIVQTLLCLGGGVLLCTTFMHLLPEVSEQISYLDKQDIHYAELLMCIGFFAMYFMEECIHFYLHKQMKKKVNVDDEHQHQEVSDYAATDHSHEDHSHYTAEFSAFRGLFVILGLSIHELFEGLAVGLESSNAKVWYMFGAVSAHKLVIAFCIGVELVASKLSNTLILVYIFTFAFVSPLGIGIGLAVSGKRQNGTTHLPSILLQGLASGSLLYVVFFEILTSRRKSGIKQFLAVLTGFCLMFGITYLEK